MTPGGERFRLPRHVESRCGVEQDGRPRGRARRSPFSTPHHYGHVLAGPAARRAPPARTRASPAPRAGRSSNGGSPPRAAPGSPWGRGGSARPSPGRRAPPSARSCPSSASASATSSSTAGSDTPTTCRRAPAGFVSGPRMFMIVGIASSRRTGATCRIAGVVERGEHEDDPRLLQHRRLLLRRQIQPYPQRLQHVRAPALRGEASVAVLRHPHPRARRQQRGRGGDVEGGQRAPAGAAGVHHLLGPARAGTGTMARRSALTPPATSAGTIPRVRSATRSAAICTGLALPPMIRPKASSASSEVSGPLDRGANQLLQGRLLRLGMLPVRGVDGAVVLAGEARPPSPAVNSTRERKPRPRLTFRRVGLAFRPHGFPGLTPYLPRPPVRRGGNSPAGSSSPAGGRCRASWNGSSPAF